MTTTPAPAAASGSSPDWVPPVEERDVVLAGHRVADLASLLAVDAVPATSGGPVLSLWHWAALAQWPRPEEIGPDGHRRQDPCLPQLPETPRRMFAGGSIDLLAPLRIGTVCRVRRQVVDIQRKQGRSGPFVLVTVEIRISDAAGALQLRDGEHARPDRRRGRVGEGRHRCLGRGSRPRRGCRHRPAGAHGGRAGSATSTGRAHGRARRPGATPGQP